MVKIISIKRKIFSKIPKENIKAIVLFGSRARGDYNKESDYDINIYTKNNNSKINKVTFDDPNELVNINVVNRKEFKHLKDLAHPFLYCAFRDGIALYQHNKWFENNKHKLSKMQPSKEIIKLYFRKGVERLIFAQWQIKSDEEFLLPFMREHCEEGKLGANNIGFALIMHYNRYPLSPHALSNEIKVLNKRYSLMANAILCLQRAYYEDKDLNTENYNSQLKILLKWSKNFMIKRFPEEYKTIRAYEKILLKAKKSFKR